MSTGQTFLNKFSKVSPTGLEWARIEYHLQLTLGSTCATVKNIWSIASGTNSYNFEKNNKVNNFTNLAQIQYESNNSNSF